MLAQSVVDGLTADLRYWGKLKVALRVAAERQYIGAGLRVAAIFRKTGGDTNTSNFSIRYGKFDSTASEIVATESTTTTHTDKETRIETRMSITALGAAGVGVITTNSLGINTGGGETGSALDRTAQIATDALSYVVFTAHCANNAAATHELLYYEVWWEA